MATNSTLPADKTALFTPKAKTYTVCYANHCPLHERCLRWEVGHYVDPNEQVLTCVNPLHKAVAEGQCPNFRTNEPHKMPLGMRQYFYYDMPRHTEQSIKHALINHYGRFYYYRYHSGRQPITPDVLQVIQTVCQRYGWTQPLQFDSEVEDYLW